MPIYNINGENLQSAYNVNGSPIVNSYDVNGIQIYPSGDVLTSFDIFYPDDATSDYEYNYSTSCTLTSEQFLALEYDGFVSNPPSGITVTKKSLGKDAGLYDIYEYDFCPQNPIRKILIVTGVHATELASQFGISLLLKHIYRIDDNTAFAYIRNNVRIKVVPVFNPYGYNQSPRTYYGYLGINPERNFAYGDLWNIYDSSASYNFKGDYPFQSDVSRIMAKWYIDNQDADFCLNCHTGANDNAYDIWTDYMANEYTVPCINAAVSKNSEKFTEKFGRTPVVNNVITQYPNSTGMGMHGMWNRNCAKVPGFWVEQAEKNTTFGNGKDNSAGSINNYASVASTYMMEMLLNKYQYIYDSIHPNNRKPITAISAENITFNQSDIYKMASLSMTPNDTTQFIFDWESSDTSICEVWSATNEAVIVKRGTGTATITVTNRSNSNISTSFIVTT